MLNNASELPHTKGHLFKTSSTSTNVRHRSVHSWTKVGLFATSLVHTIDLKMYNTNVQCVEIETNRFIFAALVWLLLTI